MQIEGMECPKCRKGKLRRTPEKDKIDGEIWVVFSCTHCHYTLEVKHVD